MRGGSPAVLSLYGAAVVYILVSFGRPYRTAPVLTSNQIRPAGRGTGRTFPLQGKYQKCPQGGSATLENPPICRFVLRGSCSLSGIACLLPCMRRSDYPTTYSAIPTVLHEESSRSAPRDIRRVNGRDCRPHPETDAEQPKPRRKFGLVRTEYRTSAKNIFPPSLGVTHG